MVSTEEYNILELENTIFLDRVTLTQLTIMRVCSGKTCFFFVHGEALYGSLEWLLRVNLAHDNYLYTIVKVVTMVVGEFMALGINNVEGGKGE